MEKIAEATRCGVDMIQLREKDLSAGDLELLARQALQTIACNSRPEKSSDLRPKFLINSRLDVAIAVGASGVHLRSFENDIAASEARTIFSKAGVHSPLVGVSCHSVSEVRFAESHGADFALVGPVFQKDGIRVRGGLKLLRQACARASPQGPEGAASAGAMPVIAIGGVTLANAHKCIAAGAAGVAGIRLFQENAVANVVESLRASAASVVTRR